MDIWSKLKNTFSNQEEAVKSADFVYRMGITNVIPRDNAIDNLLNLRKRIKSVAKKEQIIQRIQELRKLY